MKTNTNHDADLRDIDAQINGLANCGHSAAAASELHRLSVARASLLEQIEATAKCSIFGVPFSEFRPRALTISLPAGTEVVVEWGGIHLTGWEPNRPLTREDCGEVRRLLMESGVGEVSAESAARRWQYNFGEDYAPGGIRGPKQGGIRGPRAGMAG